MEKNDYDGFFEHSGIPHTKAAPKKVNEMAGLQSC